MEESRRVKLGTIIKNKWAGEGNPSKYFIYTGIKGDYATGFYIKNNVAKKIKFYKKDFQKEAIFVEVGFSNYMEIAKNDLAEVVAEYGV